MESLPQLPTSGWLIRIPAVFADLAPAVTASLTKSPAAQLGREFLWIHPADVAAMRRSPAFRFVSWNLPVHHAWPCLPQAVDSFVEKAAQAVARKFAPVQPQGAWVGPLDSGAGNSYHKRLAANLRGRLLQLLPDCASRHDPEQQDPTQASLFCLVGKQGLFCGIQSPRDSNGFYPGGSRFISHRGPAAVSRAGAKLAEALHFLPLHRPPPPAGSRWLELGASPGGMTAELLERGCQVTAIDRAPLDRRLDARPGLTFHRADVARWPVPGRAVFDALLCDLNGDPRASIQQVARLTPALRPGALVIFTLKLTGAETIDAADNLRAAVLTTASHAGLRCFAQTHLTYNRREFTLFLGFAGRPN